MKYKDFPQHIWQTLNTAIDSELKINPKPVAAFDADGTLWDTDLGESFFNYQIRNKKVKLPPDPWEHYRQWKGKDPTPAYLWLAQVNQGQEIHTVRAWAQDNVREMSPLPIYPAMQQLIKMLLHKNVSVFVVTASVKWAVEPGAAVLGIKADNVLGFQTKVINNVVSDQQEGISTYREGKLKALIQATNGIKPFLAAGNTMGDFFLLQAAKIPLVLGSSQVGNELYESEKALRDEAKKLNWLIHSFT